MHTLVNLGEHALVSTPLIKAGLGHEAEGIRRGSAAALGKLAEFAASAAADLAEVLTSDSSRHVRQAAADALGCPQEEQRRRHIAAWL